MLQEILIVCLYRLNYFLRIHHVPFSVINELGQEIAHLSFCKNITILEILTFVEKNIG